MNLESAKEQLGRGYLDHELSGDKIEVRIGDVAGEIQESTRGLVMRLIRSPGGISRASIAQVVVNAIRRSIPDLPEFPVMEKEGLITYLEENELTEYT